MPASCPYCHGPLTDDTASQARPARCPHCGNALPSAPANFTGSEETGNKPSLATFLKAGESATEAELPESDANDHADASGTEAIAAAPDTDSTPDIEIPQTEALGPETTETSEPAAQSDAPDLLANTEPAPEAETLSDVAADQTGPAPAISTPAPGFIQDAKPSSRATPWLWFALVLLTLILLLQIALADRNRLAADPDWRPVVIALCNVLDCSVPAWQEPKAFTMLDRNVRPNAQSPGTLDVTATFRNDARWAQAWPTLLVKLSDADGRTIGARAITPADYLADPAQSTVLVPGQSARMVVQVHEPEGDAVAFTFEFR